MAIQLIMALYRKRILKIIFFPILKAWPPGPEFFTYGGEFMDLKNLRINGQRLQNSLEAMAKIGATPGGGVQRLTLSDEDKQARDLFVNWLKS